MLNQLCVVDYDLISRLLQAFRKLLCSNATHRWLADVQEGIFIMSELFIETLTARLEYGPVPNKMLETLALVCHAFVYTHSV